MDQFLRKVRLRASGTGGTLLINHTTWAESPRDIVIDFDISKGISSTENPAKIRIWNLNEAHRNALGKELDNIELEAGYMPPTGGDNVGVIFKGQIRDVEHKRDGSDIVTTLSNGEGDKAFRKATISKTYRAGTEVKEVIEDIYKELEKEGISRGEWKFPEDLPRFKRPYAAVGSAKQQMDLLSRGYNFYWSCQNGVCEIIPGDGFIGNEVVITPESGLVGTPTITDNGVKAVVMLNPEIRPNRPVRIISKTLEMNAQDGRYRVSEARYSGDNFDGDFVVHITGESIKEGKVDEGKIDNLKKGSPQVGQGPRGDR